MKAFSAPGKALIAGGYLVLDPQYTAYVTALSSRMYAVIETKPTTTSSSITVVSPQFPEGEWAYDIEDGHISGASRKNPFLEATISTVLAYYWPTSPFCLRITIYSDPGYHSQDATTARVSQTGHKRFLYHTRPITEVAKTGLGSSAGLVAVTTTALVSHFDGRFDVGRDDTRARIHNLAQIAHCWAQQKIGSGFDVAAAIYGSIVYRRFAPSAIDPVFAAPPADHAETVRRAVDAEWQFDHRQCALPPGIRLLMGDIAGGSETPKLVSQVMRWRANEPAESAATYAALDAANAHFIDVLAQLHSAHAADPQAYLAQLAELLSAVSSEGLSIFGPLVAALARIRTHLQTLTSQSGADVEPPAQTALLDACGTVPGVLGGVVPGAGGYDAISLLVAADAIPNIVAATGGDSRFLAVTWLDLHEEADGVVEVDVADLSGFHESA